MPGMSSSGILKPMSNIKIFPWASSNDMFLPTSLSPPRGISLILFVCFVVIVRMVGVEPTSLAAYAPEAYAYSSSATSAGDYFLKNFSSSFMSCKNFRRQYVFADNRQVGRGVFYLRFFRKPSNLKKARGNLFSVCHPVVFKAFFRNPIKSYYGDRQSTRL